MRDLLAIDIWLTLLGTTTILLCASEFGLRLARRNARRNAGRQRRDNDNIGALQASALGLLALMIGFTFSMALNRYEARKEAVVAEANAIGTALLRARLLPVDQARETAGLLRDYALARVIPEGDSPSLDATAPFSTLAASLHERMWHQAAAAARLQPTSLPISLYVQTLNDLIDLHAKRIAGLRNRVPPAVFVLLHLIGAVALGFTGYNAVLKGHGHRFATLITAAMLGSVIIMVADLDSPRHGLITISQTPLLDLINSIPGEP